MKTCPAFLLLVLYAMAPAYGLDNPVKTESGLIAGENSVFKGIPYAAPPIGDLRWKPPQPPAHWQGVRQAAEFGSICTQPVMLAKLIGGNMSEDCLTLNIWTPAKSSAEKLPVMVWIHGGGFVMGSSSQSVYDGTALARHGVVLVSFNYRLGALGFLAHPLLSKESSRGVSGNYGLLDQIAALQWVKNNIAAFGGDPARVTIFGESAGGTSVCLLLVSPLAKGLFQQAISESAAWMYGPTTHLSESWYGRESMEKHGESLGSDLPAMRARTAGDILAKTGQLTETFSTHTVSWGPVVDGWVIPGDPADLFESGSQASVPFIAGTNSDEGGLFTVMQPVSTVAGFRAYGNKEYGGAGDKLVETYAAGTDAAVRPAINQFVGDSLFLHGTRSVVRAMARGNRNTYWYYFSRANGLTRARHMGAFHALEIGYVFGNFNTTAYGNTPSIFGNFTVRPDTFDEKDKELSAAMSGAWVRFATAGDPNGNGLPPWPPYREANDPYMEFGDAAHPGNGLRARELDVLSRLFTQMRARRAP